MLQEDQKQSLWIVFDKSAQTINELDDLVCNTVSPWRMKDESWHMRLLDAGSAKDLLPLGIEGTLQNMRAFRHRLMHGYGIDMDEEKLRATIPEAIAAYEKVEAHFRTKYPELASNPFLIEGSIKKS